MQISPTEWLFFGGGDPEQSGQGDQLGTRLVTHLDTVSHRLIKIATIPAKMFAHQVIYSPPNNDSPKGSVYVFGGLSDAMSFNQKNFKFDVATNAWKVLPKWR